MRGERTPYITKEETRAGRDRERKFQREAGRRTIEGSRPGGRRQDCLASQCGGVGLALMGVERRRGRGGGGGGRTSADPGASIRNGKTKLNSCRPAGITVFVSGAGKADLELRALPFGG